MPFKRLASIDQRPLGCWGIYQQRCCSGPSALAAAAIASVRLGLKCIIATGENGMGVGVTPRIVAGLGALVTIDYKARYSRVAGPICAAKQRNFGPPGVISTLSRVVGRTGCVSCSPRGPLASRSRGAGKWGSISLCDRQRGTVAYSCKIRRGSYGLSWFRQWSVRYIGYHPRSVWRGAQEYAPTVIDSAAKLVRNTRMIVCSAVLSLRNVKTQGRPRAGFDLFNSGLDRPRAGRATPDA